MRTLGLRVRSGFAIAVVVEGDLRSWRVIRREDVLLTAETGAYARFPFHPLIELSQREGVPASRDAVATVRSESKRRFASLLESIGSVDSGGIVGGSMTDPDTISNPHMRAHAREAHLFREVVAKALDRAGIPHLDLRDKEAYRQVATVLAVADTRLRADVDVKGRGVVRPWRADEKLATLGALHALTGSTGLLEPTRR